MKASSYSHRGDAEKNADEFRLAVFYFSGRLAKDWRTTGCAGRLELHVLDAGEVGVKEVELDLTVAAHLGLSAVGAFAVVAGESLDDVAHAGGAEREVVDDAKYLGGRIGAGF